jgi:hypothetical protein
MLSSIGDLRRKPSLRVSGGDFSGWSYLEKAFLTRLLRLLNNSEIETKGRDLTHFLSLGSYRPNYQVTKRSKSSLGKCVPARVRCLCRRRRTT